MTLDSQGRWKKRGVKEKREWVKGWLIQWWRSFNPLIEQD
jgi:hypothetical protein